MSIRIHLTFTLGLMLPGGVATAQQAAPKIAEKALPTVEVFEAAPDLPTPEAVPAEFIHVHAIRLSAGALRALAPGAGVTLAPEPGLGEPWFVESVSEPAGNVRIVRCRHATDPTGYAAFVTYDGATAMSMQIASRKASYRLQFAGNDRYHVWKVNHAALPPDGEPLSSPSGSPRVLDRSDDDWQPEPPVYQPLDAGGCGIPPAHPVLDIMMVYTPAARDEIGGDLAMQAECALAVDHTNTAYKNSLLSTRMRLVYSSSTNYTESGDEVLDLDRLRDLNDGFMDEVHTLRDSLNADMIQLLTATIPPTVAGRGYCPSDIPTYGNHPFSTCRWNYAAANYTTAHETGHNFGAGHDVANGGPCGLLHPWGVGHYFGPVNNGWSTVMAASDPNYDRVLYYSNPSATHEGYATGVPIGQPGQAYNAQVIDYYDGYVEAFEQTRYDIYVNFAWDSLELGTAYFPYNTVPEGVSAIAVPGPGAGENPTLYLSAGSTTWTGTISKAMNIIACSGTATIGQ